MNFLALIFFSVFTLFSAQSEPFLIRVHLDEFVPDAPSNQCWTITAQGGVVLSVLKNDEGNTFKKVYRKKLVIKRSDGSLFFNGKEISACQYFIRPVNNNVHITINGISYHGGLLVNLQNNIFYLMNLVDSEQYVSAVVRKESWPGWPEEFNKAFSIVCRTYALSKVLKARAQRKRGVARVPYDIRSTSLHQVYGGAHNCLEVIDAVKKTEGIVIAYRGQPIEAMFDACCGGAVTAKMRGIDFTKAPYLARTERCTLCKKHKQYEWEVEYSSRELCSLFKDELMGGKKIKSLRIKDRDDAGFVHQLLFEGSRVNALISGKKAYSVLKKLKSTFFTVHTRGDSYVFRGRGSGHCIGFCQWGAKQMIAQGQNYKEVIAFYYPHTNLMRIR